MALILGLWIQLHQTFKQYSMLRNYFLTAWRNLFINKTSSFINICGLAVGLATGILIMLVVLDELNYDKFQSNLQSIYLVMKNQKRVDGISTGEATAGPLAASIRSEMQEAKYAARVAHFDDEVMEADNKTQYGSGIYADADIFQMMSFPAVQGNPVQVLQNSNQVVLTESTARKFFGGSNPMGQTISFGSKGFLVGAVVKDIPEASSLRFDIVFPFSYFESNNTWLSHWDDNRIQTWVSLQPNANTRLLSNKLTQLLQTRSNDKSVSLFVYPLSKLHLYNSFSNGKPNGRGAIQMLHLLIALGVFVILVACINFMNIATARSEKRSREVGVRKALGASRAGIIIQFLSEAMVTTFIALILAVLIAKLVLPWFNQFAGKSISFNLNESDVWWMLLVTGSFTGLAAGSYPAFFMSRFKTIKVLKGSFFSKRGGGLRKSLVTLQFIISAGLIVATTIIYKQINFVRNRPLGYNQEKLMDITANGALLGKLDVFTNELQKIPGIHQVSAGSDNIVNFGGSITGMDYPGKIPGEEISVMVSNIGYNWTNTLHIPLVAGRDFSTSFVTDTTACIINEAAIRKMNLKEPVLGSKIGGYSVIGVFHDFVYNNPSGIIAPMLLTLKPNNLPHFFVRLSNDTESGKTITQIRNVVKKLNPGFPFEYTFTKDIYQQRFTEWDAFGLMATIFGCMAIFIASLGLFGLSSFLAERRGKEISIRKTFGASSLRIWVLLSVDFLKPVLIALLIVIPSSVWLAHSLLAGITYHTGLSWWLFGLATGITVLIALLTVSYQATKAAIRNPVKELRADS